MQGPGHLGNEAIARCLALSGPDAHCDCMPHKALSRGSVSGGAYLFLASGTAHKACSRLFPRCTCSSTSAWSRWKATRFHTWSHYSFGSRSFSLCLRGEKWVSSASWAAKPTRLLSQLSWGMELWERPVLVGCLNSLNCSIIFRWTAPAFRQSILWVHQHAFLLLKYSFNQKILINLIEKNLLIYTKYILYTGRIKIIWDL